MPIRHRILGFIANFLSPGPVMPCPTCARHGRGREVCKVTTHIARSDIEPRDFVRDSPADLERNGSPGGLFCAPTATETALLRLLHGATIACGDRLAVQDRQREFLRLESNCCVRRARTHTSTIDILNYTSTHFKQLPCDAAPVQSSRIARCADVRAVFLSCWISSSVKSSPSPSFVSLKLAARNRTWLLRGGIIRTLLPIHARLPFHRVSTRARPPRSLH